MFSKSLSRSDRFKEMSRQQELIEEKKRKIQEQMDMQKNSTEDVQSSGNNSKPEQSGRQDAKPVRSYNRMEKFRQMSRQQELIEEKMRMFREKKEKEVDEQANIEDPIKLEPVKNKNIPECPKPPIPPLIPNLFSNDGSFLDQFLKLSSDIQVPAEKNKGDSDPGVLIKTEPEEPMNIFKSEFEPSSSVKTEPVETGVTAVEKLEEVKIEPIEVKVEVKTEAEEVEPPPVTIPPVVIPVVTEEPAIIKMEPEEILEDEAAKSARRERKRKSRWGEKAPLGALPDVKKLAASATVPTISITGMSGHMISKVTRSDPGLLKYAASAYGTVFLSEEDWKKAEDNYKVHLLYQDMLNKRAELDRLHSKGKHKFEYDSDEETEGGTWEHRLREKEMTATRQWADSLTEMAKGKHHIGDFLPPDELKRFMEKYKSAKGEGDPDLSDYKEFKLKEDNKGFQMLQKLGWTEGQGLGSEGAGIVDPINKAKPRDLAQGLGAENPGDVSSNDDEYAAYRKRMMLAYRFRPNPLNNPRRPYY